MNESIEYCQYTEYACACLHTHCIYVYFPDNVHTDLTQKC